MRVVIIATLAAIMLVGCHYSSNRTATAGGNLAPMVGSHPVYRAYPGYSIELPIDAADPKGGGLTFTSSNLPEEASLDAGSGVLADIRERALSILVRPHPR